MGSVDPEISRLLSEAEAEEFPPILLTPVADHLQHSASDSNDYHHVHLYETHLPVSDTEAAREFYVEIVGLKFAHRDLTRDIVFLWAGDDRRSMLGLWGPTTIYGSDFHECHIAFRVLMTELLAVGERLNAANINTQNFAGEETTEPSVIGWMPSAQLYFRDPDGHSLEFITLLNESPHPSFVGSLSAWKQRKRA